MTAAPELSVVLACASGSAPAAASLGALAEACRDRTAELIVARAAGVSTEPPVRSGMAAPLLVEGAPDALVPELWALGAEAARGAVIGFTIPECRVPKEWAAALLEGLRGGATGAGGGFELAEDAGLVTRATYFLRYSAFLTPQRSEGRAEIAGDNAAYDGDALRRHRESLAKGFWEMEFHRRIRAEGARLTLVREATAMFQGPVRFGAMWRQRRRHGRHFAAWRVRECGQRRWRIVAAAPLVPFVLVGRILTRLRTRPRLVRGALPTLPVLLALAAAWALGEAEGAIGA